MMTKKDLRSLTLHELKQLVTALGDKEYRAGQLFSWLHQKQVDSLDKMTNLSAAFREKLERETNLITLKPVQILESKLDDTKKFLFQLPDGQQIESVYMRYRYGNSVCISSQAGCRMGCKFCASTLDGMVRNLTPSEMLEQVYRAGQLTNTPISHVVVMGSGEPLDNYENVVRFLQLVSDPQGAGISRRNLTVSTCGLVPQIIQFAEESLACTLALSLHAPTDELRRQLMPIARRYTIEETLKACDFYFQKTGRRVSYEYSLIKGLNDSSEQARALAGLLKGKNCHVNLIPVNPIRERNFESVDGKAALAFQNTLEKCGIHVTIRREMGRDIQGACGQLRRACEQNVT